MIESLKTSLICTVLNEEKTITQFLESINSQSKLADEVIIIDGGSRDGTVSKINGFKSKKKLNLKVFIKKGNRSVGRNFAIKKSSFGIILSSDAGCVLDRDWVKNIAAAFINKNIDVASGYYKPVTRNIFEKCLSTYTCVMPNRIEKENFLPSSRSVAFRKSAWKKVDGYPEDLDTCEDLVFDKRLKDLNLKFVFTKNAIVYWTQRKNIFQAFKQFFSYAVGDGYANYFRSQTPFLFLRYLFAIYLVILSVIIKSFLLYGFVFLAPVIYVTWAIAKNYNYVRHKKALFILPFLQITSDIAVLSGTTWGYVKHLLKVNYLKVIKNNFPLLMLLVIYTLSVLSMIGIGIPNQYHPFPYQMDEWHQSQSVRNVFKFGTPNLPGAANGSMFHFFLSGVLLIPFALLKIVNPFVIKNAIDAMPMQEGLFIILRLNTLFFGVLTLILMSKIAKILKLSSFLAVLLFFVTSAWLSLSNFFKYDIALTFWVVLSLYYLIKYRFAPTLNNFIFGSIFCALALSVKVSALPLLPILVLAYFLFTPSVRNNFKTLIVGVFIYCFTVIFFGIPDIIFGGRSMFYYLYENIINSPGSSGMYNLGSTLWNFTLLHKLPLVFGHLFYGFSVISLFFVLGLLIKNFLDKKYVEFKIQLFLFLSFVLFALSVVWLKVFISANRLLVLLPFFVIFDLLFIKRAQLFLQKRKVLAFVLSFVFIVLFLIQIFESYLWVGLRFSALPEQAASKWVLQNIPKNSNVGLENIPIYQDIPDYMLKEFYNKQYYPSVRTRFNYTIVNSNTKTLPKYIVISNVNYEQKFFKVSVKNELVAKLKKDGYKIAAYFPLQLPLYKYFDSYFYYPYMSLIAFPESIVIFKK